MNRLQTHLACFALMASAVACSDTSSATDLNPDGPPMIRQILMSEATTGNSSQHVFGFGNHPDNVDMSGNPNVARAHHVNTAYASNNVFRIIMDELLVGNSLQEIQCRGIVDSDDYDRVPLGATPDDIARCSAPKDVLKTSCQGELATCVCHLPGGCVVPDMTGQITVAEGEPVGIVDTNADGAADNMRFIQGSVGIKCGAVDVPIQLSRSYWNPSGDQNIPAVGGTTFERFYGLGPAIVLAPAAALPTGATCGLTFAPDVTDKTGNAVCTPLDGDINNPCTPGDVSAFSFTVQPLSIQVQGLVDGQTNVGRTDPLIIIANVPLALDAATKMTIVADVGAVPFTNYMTTFMSNNQILFVQPQGTGFAATTAYTLTLPATITDATGSPLPAPVVLHFTTGA